MTNTHTPRLQRKVFVCNQDFIANVNGVDKHYREGISRVYEGDEILDRCPELFDPIDDYDRQHGA